MSNAADAALLVSRILTVLDAAIQMTGNAAKYRQIVGQAIAEGRDLNDAELDALRDDARAAVDRLGG